MELVNICRTCFCTLEESKNLFDTEYDMIKKIQFIAAIKLEDYPGLSTQICEKCFMNINLFYDFRKTIIDTNKKLNTLKFSKSTVKTQSRKETIIEKSHVSSQDLLHNKKSNIYGSEAQADKLNKHIEDSVKSIPESHRNGPKTLPLDPPETESRKNIISSIIAQGNLYRRIYKCVRCKKKFESRVSLYNHKRSEHAAPSVCNICGVKIRADNLNKHIRTHSQDPVKCDECGKLLKNAESLRSHKFLHSDKSYICEICGKSFKLKAERGRHLKMHQDPDLRKSSCKLCGKKVSELKRHMQTHTGEKPHICNNCGKGFCSSYSLKVHLRLHTNEKPFVCNYCDNSFPQKVSLLSHLRNKHDIS